MMYNNQLVCALKVNGKILRENKDQVKIPFSEEYSIYLKNLNSTKARIKVEIDGVDIADGTRFILNPGETLDLERFVKNGNMNEGNKFKFIQRTEKIEDHRGGIQLEDGLVRIEFEFEQKQQPVHRTTYIDHYYHRPHYREYSNYPWAYPYGISSTLSGAAVQNYQQASLQCSSGEILASSAAQSIGSNAVHSDAMEVNFASSETFNDAGITAPGSKSEQSFTYGYFGTSDGVKHVMTFKLLGEIGEKKVERPITVKTKNICSTCGTDNPHSSKFCKECGSALELL